MPYAITNNNANASREEWLLVSQANE
jgi:hypothetical protein